MMTPQQLEEARDVLTRWRKLQALDACLAHKTSFRFYMVVKPEVIHLQSDKLVGIEPEYYDVFSSDDLEEAVRPMIARMSTVLERQLRDLGVEVPDEERVGVSSGKGDRR